MSTPTYVGLLVLSAATAVISGQTGGPPAAKDVLPAISAEVCRGIDEKLASFGTRHTLSDTASETRGVGAARRWIKSELESFNKDGGKLEVSFEEFIAPKGKRIPEPTPTANVIAILPGTMPEAAGRRYYVMGHYDSMPSPRYNPETEDSGWVPDYNTDAPGANDDGSGTTAVIAIARAMAKHPLEATVVFICTVGEEQGLIGATYHASKAKGDKEDIRAVLNNDIIGDSLGPGGDKARATPGLVRVFSEALPKNPSAEKLAQIRSLASESDSPSRELARYIVEVAAKEKTAVQPMLVYRQDRFLRGGDHIPFNEAGFPAIRFCEVSENYKHQHQTPRVETVDGKPVQYGDLLEFVDFEYLANVAKLNAATLVNLANAPSTPGKVRIVTAKLETLTQIRWEKSPEPDVAGYEVVWRDTTSPKWEHVKDVGLATEITLDENKDNLFFGVRAYDKDGYRSPVGFAGAAKE
jgi:Zn-dependent M28 family amino/carboxypeptidase